MKETILNSNFIRLKRLNFFEWQINPIKYVKNTNNIFKITHKLKNYTVVELKKIMTSEEIN